MRLRLWLLVAPWAGGLAFFAFPSQAQSKFDVSGRVTSGVAVEGFKHGEVETKAKVKVKTDRVAKTRAEIKVEASNLDRDLEIEEAFIDHKLGGDAKLEIGLTKKILGLEYEMGDNDRLAINRSLIYRKLENFAYVGEETAFRWRKNPDDGTGDMGHMLGIGYGESLDAHISAALMREFAPGWQWSVWGLVQSDRINAQRQVVWATMASLLLDADGHRLEVELAAGQDPFESELQKTYGDGKDHHYAGLKTLYGLDFDLGDDTGIMPYGGASLLYHDLDIPEYNSYEILLGVRYRFSKALQIAADLNLVGTNSRLEPGKRSYYDSIAALEAKYVF